MKVNKYKFMPGDLIITGRHHMHPGHKGILVERIDYHGIYTWRIHWVTDIPYPYRHTRRRMHGIARTDREGVESEMNLYNLRKLYHYYNEQGEYYENSD